MKIEADGVVRVTRKADAQPLAGGGFLGRRSEET